MVSKAFSALRGTQRQRAVLGEVGRRGRRVLGRGAVPREAAPEPAALLTPSAKAVQPSAGSRPRSPLARSLARSPRIRRGLGAQPGKHLLKSDLLLQQLSDSGRSWHADSWNTPASKAVEMKEGGGGVRRWREEGKREPTSAPIRTRPGLLQRGGGEGGQREREEEGPAALAPTQLELQGRGSRRSRTEARTLPSGLQAGVLTR